MIAVGLAFLMGLVLATTAFLLTGGGHGFFWPAIILFPYSFLVSNLPGLQQSQPVIYFALSIAVTQFPAYVVLFGLLPET